MLLLEISVLTVCLVLWLFGSDPGVLVFKALLWAQVITGVLGFLIKGGLWGLLTLGGGIGGAEESGAVGGLLGAAIVGGVGLWEMVKYLFRKALLIGACWLVLASLSGGNAIAAVFGGLVYGLGAFWALKVNWSYFSTFAKGFFGSLKESLESG